MRGLVFDDCLDFEVDLDAGVVVGFVVDGIASYRMLVLDVCVEGLKLWSL